MPNKTPLKVLFILKLGQGYYSYSHSSSGLFNSAMGCVRALEASGVSAKLTQVVDNNDIDREVSSYQPDVVIIEALWVVPEKFAVLTKLHPKVKWVVRIHSKLAFLSGEGIAMKWLHEYGKFPNVWISFNDNPTRETFEVLTNKRVLYLPTCYQIRRVSPTPSKKILNVACFGAIRPLKNQLAQAVAAIEAAKQINRKLRFHINTSRVEMLGDSALKNLRELFAAHPSYELVEHPWYNEDTLPGVLREMSIGMQVSLSETFNITAADMASAGLPLVVSSEIPWASASSIVAASDIEEIKKKILWVLRWPKLNNKHNLYKLANYAAVSQEVWVKTIRELAHGQLR